ncbi:uncharacterized protein LOC127439527 isoform X2 [Myxocyprinus asiaticus]|uniref:uncharacterized protein LOC127439527 isoform X2 n=1 Tax=Myxocyprinus asiaticus TaxID=70543 RepID=UPI002222455D|nr:uncharacterized protein LOC127439527 isoform X2 [Myxocyprinus asiaticus]
MKGSFVLLIQWVLLIDGVFGVDEMKTSVSVMEGDSPTLRTAVTGLQNDKSDFIKWYFNHNLIAQIRGDLSKFCTDVKCETGQERFRDRLKLNNQTGSLTIKNISITDSGDYNLLTFINNINDEKTFTVTVQPGVSGAEMKIKSMIEGASVTLHTDDTVKQGDVVMTWYFNDTRIAEMNEDPSKSCTDVTCDEGAERFRDRLKIDHQTGDLTITNTRTTDSGLYQLEISSSISSSCSVKSFSVNVSASDLKTPDPGLSSGDIAGICVGVVLVVAVTAGVIYYRCKISRRGQNGIKMQHNVQENDGVNPPPHQNGGGNELTPLNDGVNELTPLNDGVNELTPLNDGVNEPTPPNDGVNEPTPPNDGVNEPTPPNDGVNELTPPNDGVNELTPPNDGVNELTPPNDGVNEPTPPNDGVNELTPPNDGVNEPTPPNDGVNEPTPPEGGVNEPTLPEGGVNEPTLPEGGVNEPTPPDGGVNE